MPATQLRLAVALGSDKSVGKVVVVMMKAPALIHPPLRTIVCVLGLNVASLPEKSPCSASIAVGLPRHSRDWVPLNLPQMVKGGHLAAAALMRY